MKTKALIIMLALVPFWLFSEVSAKDNKYSRGKIFLLNNDTIEVFIRSEPLFNLQNGIHYLDSTKRECSMLPANSKGFCLIYKNDSMYFESRKDLKLVLLSSKKSKSSFVHRVSTGNLPLYYFVEKQLVMNGIDQVSSEYPRYIVLHDQEWYSLTPKNFISDFKKLISNLKGVFDSARMQALLQEVADAKYNFETTPLLIEKLKQIPAAKY